MMLAVIILCSLLVLLIIVIISIKNGLIEKSNQVENSFSTIDVMLKKRFDLIPQLQDCVKGYMQHESALLEKLSQLRSTIRDTQNLANKDEELKSTVQRILIKAEAYPDLKANQQFLKLQMSISEMEEQLSASRRTYNMSITEYNNSVMKFPSNIIAKRNNFQQKQLFKFNES